MKMERMTSLVMSVGSWTISSATKKTIPTSLKQLEANKKAIPVASTASPSWGWILFSAVHDSNLAWNCLTKEINSDLAATSPLF